MMVKCEGRSIHTLTMPNKPIDHGYKLFALAEHGYTYSWVHYSPANKHDASKSKLTIVPFGCLLSGSTGTMGPRFHGVRQYWHLGPRLHAIRQCWHAVRTSNAGTAGSWIQDSGLSYLLHHRMVLLISSNSSLFPLGAAGAS